MIVIVIFGVQDLVVNHICEIFLRRDYGFISLGNQEVGINFLSFIV